MKCDKCGFANEENLKYCGDCGNKLAIPEQLKAFESKQITKSELEPKYLSAIVKNYRVIFNVFFYIVTAFNVLYILSGAAIPAVLFGHLMNILLNPFVWAFYILIFKFKKNPRDVTGILSIIFGSLNILFVFYQVFILGI